MVAIDDLIQAEEAAYVLNNHPKILKDFAPALRPVLNPSRDIKKSYANIKTFCPRPPPTTKKCAAVRERNIFEEEGTPLTHVGTERSGVYFFVFIEFSDKFGTE